ncbi:MAG TPA: glycosyltransferase [Bacillota bacterium]
MPPTNAVNQTQASRPDPYPPPPLSAPPLVSVIFPARDEGANVATTLASLATAEVDVPFEAIVVDDGSQDGCCHLTRAFPYPLSIVRTRGLGAPQARNLGARLAKGRYYVFCDAHLDFPPHWLDALVEPLAQAAATGGDLGAVSPGLGVPGDPRRAGFGQTWNDRLEVTWLKPPKGITEVPLLPGGCMAFRAEVFRDIGGFDHAFQTWGHEDEEISIKLWLFGHNAAVVPETVVGHLFRQRHPYRVTLWDAQYNQVRMAVSHFNEVRVGKVIALLQKYSYWQQLVEISRRAAQGQREDFFARRRRSDDWFMERFGIPF